MNSAHNYERGIEEMSKFITKLICKYGTALCSLAVIAGTIGTLSCRGLFYQPAEPEGLKNLFEER